MMRIMFLPLNRMSRGTTGVRDVSCHSFPKHVYRYSLQRRRQGVKSMSELEIRGRHGGK